MVERLSIGIILCCAAIVIGVVISLGRMDIAFILIIILALAALPAKWFRDWFWNY
ncbi:hypothetical protein ACFVSS_25160 [Peribacillus butanolivorans]|uniref:hypothetical protein n=1 Tax=Peribacillus butanolivorans TaxID=421767 RepID=UPI0036DEB6A7